MAQLTIAQAFDLALRHEESNRIQEAEQIYRQILAQQPQHADALHMLGVITQQVGRHDVAVDLIGQAIVIKPDYPEAICNLGNALQSMGEVDQAIEAYRQAIALRPDLPDAFNNLGNALYGKRLLDEAIIVFRQALALRPDYPQAYVNLGNVLKDQGKLDDAIAAYGQAIARNPNLSEAHNNLGNVLLERGQLQEAIVAYRRAVALNPHNAKAYSNLGNAFRKLNHWDDAVAACREAISINPGFAEAHNNLGNALKDDGQPEKAIAAYRQALALNPNFAECQYNLGNTLQFIGRPDEAAAALRRAIALKPDYSEAYNNLGNVLKDTGQLDDAIAAYRQAIVLNPHYADAQSNLVYALNFHPGYDARAIYEAHVRWEQQAAQSLRQFVQPHPNDRTPGRRLKIGYVSPDFVEHPVGRFLLPLLSHHDHERFEIFAYAQVSIPDALTHRIHSRADQWRSLIGLSDAQAAQRIRDDRIDILVDLTMQMAHNRLLVFARKPAPVQVTYLASAGTTGLSTIDYRLSDPYLDPAGVDETVYSEQTIRLPDSYWCYDPLDSREIPVNALPAMKQGAVTFGGLNNFCKVSQPLLNLWARLLCAVPNSRLLLHAHEGVHRRRVLESLQREGVDPQRTTFVEMLPRRAYFELYHSIDIALDTFPYGGGTTTCDALWMGVPVVSLVGQTAVGRGGLSILSNIGLAELAAAEPEQYVQIAIKLANDLPRLAQLRSTLRQRMQQSALTDAPRFARNVEAVYRQVWEKWCAKGIL